MKKYLVVFILLVLVGCMGWLFLCGNRTNYGFRVIISEKLISHRGGGKLSGKYNALGYGCGGKKVSNRRS